MLGVRELYSRRARHYDLTSNLYYLAGVPVRRYRREAVDALCLRKGDRVLEIACGTGLNFSLLEQAVGEEGQLTGVDLTAAMLAKAKERVEKHGWKNVELIETDVSNFTLDRHFDAVLCTFAISLMADIPEVLKRATNLLRDEGRLAVLDVKNGSSKPLNYVASILMKPFGATNEVLCKRPWQEMLRYLREVRMKEHYLGIIYVASGTKGGVQQAVAADAGSVS